MDMRSSAYSYGSSNSIQCWYQHLISFTILSLIQNDTGNFVDYLLCSLPYCNDTCGYSA